jgi:hypothetical protein
VRPAKIFQTTTFRLAVSYVLLFAAAVAALGVITYMTTSVALERRLDARIESEMASLQTVYRSGGLSGLVAAVDDRERAHPGGPLDYLLLGAHGERLAGTLSKAPSKAGWSSRSYSESDGGEDQLRVLVAPVTSGVRLAIGADILGRPLHADLGIGGITLKYHKERPHD